MVRVVVLLFGAMLLYGQTAADVVVYGATPAGIAAAVRAARAGRNVLLLEPSAQVGGLLTGGLSYTDFRTQEAVTGFFREYMDRVLAHYESTYGKGSAAAGESFEGALAEPKVARRVLEGMLAEEKTLRVWRRAGIESVITGSGSEGKRRILRAQVKRGEERETVAAQFWIDATYEGDLAARAKVPYRLGREGREVYGEKYAGRLYFNQGKILEGSSGEGDDSEQCANYRVLMTEKPELRLPVPRPSEYRREEFTHLLPLFASGRIREIYTEDRSGILRLQRLPNGKSDMNDIKQAPVRLALPGENQGWSEGDEEERTRIAKRHENYAKGLLYFLQNDAEVPGEIRAKAKAWGLARDEFVENANWPNALYVREGRRIEGSYTFREQDTQPVEGSARAAWQKDAVAIGDYVLNNHGHHPPGELHPGLVEGDFAAPTVPFQIPFGVMQPRSVENLLVPVAVSASHVGYSAIRLEPTWTALGHAAGVAADLALSEGSVDVGRLQERLHRQGQATIYVSDIGARDPRFMTIQWAGAQGLLQGPGDAAKAMTPQRRYGLQYYYAFPEHESGWERPLEQAQEEAWKKALGCARQVTAKTRGEFFEKARAACRAAAEQR